MLVVSNTSPLIILYKCDQLGLLRDLFGQVFIPEAVYQEAVHNTQDREQSKAIAQCGFIHSQPVVLNPHIFNYRLDVGELEAIMLALESQADYLILDDKRAQKEAQRHKLTVIPTFAILLKAVQKGLIADLDVVLAQLKRAQIFPNPELGLGAKGFLVSDHS